MNDSAAKPDHDHATHSPSQGVAKAEAAVADAEAQFGPEHLKVAGALGLLG